MELNSNKMLYIYRSRIYRITKLNYVLAIFQTPFHSSMTLLRWNKNINFEEASVLKHKIIFQIYIP